MADIKPFKGVLFNQDKVEDIRLVLTPPYDVISEEECCVYSENSPYNIVRLILPEGNGNKYSNAAKTMEEWLKEEILVQDKEPAFYLYEEEFYLEDGEIRRRLGFMAAVKVEDYDKKVVLPHESTLTKPREDRLELIKTTKANFEPIFAIYNDPKNIVRSILEIESKRAPLFEFTDDAEVKHKVWPVTDSKSVKKIQDALKERSLYIADGHHRYQAALDYKNKVGNGGDYTLMFLVDTNDPGMVVLPTHRVIKKLDKFDEEEFEEKLVDYFDVTTYKFEGKNEVDQRNKMFHYLSLMKDKHAFGVFAGGSKYYLVSLKDRGLVETAMNANKSRDWRELDAAVLHYILMEKVLGFKTTGENYEENILFVKDKENAIEMLYDKKYQIALFMNATKPEQVMKVADKGERMPQKSTYFYPKPLSGLVFYKFE